MSKKDNFSQAMFEMFGLGKSPEEGEEELDDLKQIEELNEADIKPVPEEEAPVSSPSAYVEEPVYEPVAEPVVEPDPVPVPAEPAPAPAPAPEVKHEYVRRENCTYFAPGTSMEGTLRSDSDVEIAGDFKGEIASDGKVTIHANTQSSIAAAELVLIDCTLTGDAMVGGDVSINETSSITGNVRASNIVCSGIIKGNLNVQSNITLTENAQVIGDIKTGTLAMSRGAKVSGKIDMGN